jgi:hypothetical protein
MRAPGVAVGLIAFAALMASVPGEAAVRSPHRGLDHRGGVAHLVDHRKSARHHRGYRKHRHYRSNHHHLRGLWNHDHCGDWHGCHYYFYGYKQWLRWNPGKSRADFIRRYHHR